METIPVASPEKRRISILAGSTSFAKVTITLAVASIVKLSGSITFHAVGETELYIIANIAPFGSLWVASGMETLMPGVAPATVFR